MRVLGRNMAFLIRAIVREGAFPGMRADREIRVIVSEGWDANNKSLAQKINYSGEKVEVKIGNVKALEVIEK